MAEKQWAMIEKRQRIIVLVNNCSVCFARHNDEKKTGVFVHWVRFLSTLERSSGLQKPGSSQSSRRLAADTVEWSRVTRYARFSKTTVSLPDQALRQILVLQIH